MAANMAAGTDDTAVLIETQC